MSTNIEPNHRIRLQDYGRNYGAVFRHCRTTSASRRCRRRVEIAATTARYAVSRMRDTVSGLRAPRHDVVLTRTTVSGSVVTLRPPRIDDGPCWREIRLRDRDHIEPYWVSGPQEWSERHSAAAWIRETLTARKDARAGNLVPTMVDVGGRLAGQCDLWVDRFHRRGELSIWVDSRLAGQGIATTAALLLVGYGFTELGLDRISAPVDVDNCRSARLADRVGMTREGTMAGYMSVGGRRRDHDLWAVTAGSWPPVTPLDAGTD